MIAFCWNLTKGLAQDVASDQASRNAWKTFRSGLMEGQALQGKGLSLVSPRDSLLMGSPVDLLSVQCHNI